MFRELTALNTRPEPFSVYTAELLWTDPHIARNMLAYHLNAEVDLASRNPAAIDGTIDWIDRRVGFAGKAVLDLGCGPGLYASRMARRGARVTGLDFSANSVAHAREAAERDGLAIDYVQADYLKDPLPGDQDLATLIYCDMGVLSPDDRARLLGRIRTALGPGGTLVFDLLSAEQFDGCTEEAVYERRMMDGFWAPGDYFGFKTSFVYADLKLALDRYRIVEPDRTRDVYNWFQFFTPDGIAAELAAAGFELVDTVDVLTGEPWTAAPREFAVIARIPA